MPRNQLSWISSSSENGVEIAVNLNLYSLEALFRVCYSFTDRCYLFLDHESQLPIVRVRFGKMTETADLNVIAGEFSNELINQKVRLDVAAETRAIRELIVAQAFAEVPLIDRPHAEADYHDDPKGIAR